MILSQTYKDITSYITVNNTHAILNQRKRTSIQKYLLSEETINELNIR